MKFGRLPSEIDKQDAYDFIEMLSVEKDNGSAAETQKPSDVWHEVPEW